MNQNKLTLATVILALVAWTGMSTAFAQSGSSQPDGSGAAEVDLVEDIEEPAGEDPAGEGPAGEDPVEPDMRGELPPGARGPALEDVVMRDRLVADQETLLNVYRCLFDVDTGAVPGGCVNGEPARGPTQPGVFEGVPTQGDVDARDRLIADQEALLNVYRCQFNVDTQIVPGGCRA